MQTFKIEISLNRNYLEGVDSMSGELCTFAIGIPEYDF